MSERQPPEFLIEDVLLVGAAAALVSAPGIGKTFLALDMSFCIAAGIPWHGLKTKQMSVAYVLAEGIGGISSRVRAWRLTHNIARGVPVGVGLWFWDRDIQLATYAGQQQINAALLELETQFKSRPGFIVVDTLARCFAGLDENAAQDMGRFVQGIDMLRATGATVLVLHHEGHLKGRERGSTALRGAVDTLIHLAPNEITGGLSLTCSKQREAEPFDPINLRLRTIELPDDEASCIVEELPDDAVPMAPKWMNALEALGKFENGATAMTWQQASGLTRRTFFRMKATATKRNLIVERSDGTFVLVTKGQNGGAS